MLDIGSWGSMQYQSAGRLWCSLAARLGRTDVVVGLHAHEHMHKQDVTAAIRGYDGRCANWLRELAQRSVSREAELPKPRFGVGVEEVVRGGCSACGGTEAASVVLDLVTAG